MVDFSKNFFELFGLPVGFGLDKAELSERYRELQRLVHPDRFASGSDQERRISLQQATQVNEAFETLKDPLKRAQYLLQLNGLEDDGQQTTKDTAFLMGQMELREELAEARHQADPHAALDKLMRQIGDMIKTVVTQMTLQFESATPEQLAAASESVRKMQFLNKLHAEAEALEAELEEAH